MEWNLETLKSGLIAGNRAELARSITLVESRKASHEALAQDLLEPLLGRTGRSIRVGISGPPGVGKSTLIDELGMHILEKGHKVAVLAIDPSSQVSGGSILGDKTRMHRLAGDPRAFIRPSPSDSTLGGIARRTREAMLLCEVAGFDVILIETVGVGQSEYSVESLVDVFVLLLLPGAGDELQGIKRGIMESADVIAITKADGENVLRCHAAKQQVEAALHYLRPKVEAWLPSVREVSAQESQGIEELWSDVCAFKKHLLDKGLFDKRRQENNVQWMRTLVSEFLEKSFRDHAEVKHRLTSMTEDVRRGKVTPSRAAMRLLDYYRESPTD